MAKISVKIEPDLEVGSTLEDQQTQPESTGPTSFCYETVVKDEVIIEDDFAPSQAESDDQPLAVIKEKNKKDMFCKECNKLFTNRALFRTHKYKHRVVKQGKFTCKICEKRFRDKYALTIHLQGVHLVPKLNKPIKSKKTDVKRFPKTVTSQTGQYKCSECDERFEFQYQQLRHIRRHNILKRELFKCEECSKAFATPWEFKSHMRRAHEKHAKKRSQVSVKEEGVVFICTKCNKSFEQRHLCRRHVLRHIALMKERVFDCSKCPKKFISKKYLEKHEAWHEESSKKQSEIIKCDDCNMILKNKHILVRHMERHVAVKEGRFECKVCNERLGSNRELILHTAKHKRKLIDAQDGYKPPIIIERNNHSAFQCPDCGKIFTFRRIYSNHAVKHIHLRNGTYKCDICDKVCGSAKSLDTHMRGHRKREIKACEPIDKSFECFKCNKTFAKKLLLERHMKIHNAIEEGLYKCKFCAKYLGSAGSLAVHEQGHLGETEYQCSECDRSYTRKDSYASHVRRKHGREVLIQQVDVKTEES